MSKQKNVMENITSFSTLKLQVAIGKWLRLIPYHKTCVVDESSPDKVVSPEELEQTTKMFRHLLSLAGIDSSEPLVLNRYNENDNSFTLHQTKTNRFAKVSLRYGDGLDFCDEIDLFYQEEGKEYLYNMFQYPDEEKPRLSLQLYSEQNKENNNTFSKWMSPYRYDIAVKCGEYIITIKAQSPHKGMVNYDNILYFKNEEELKKYLLSLSFPVDISEVYKKFCEITQEPTKQYPTFNIEVKRNGKTTDSIQLKKGSLVEATITKDGKTVTIDQDGSNWSYETENVKIISEDGKASYHLTSVDFEKIGELASISDQVKKAREEVETITQYTKSFK